MFFSISSDELYQKLLTKSDITLLDIRSSKEHKDWSIYNSINIPFEYLFKKYNGLSRKKQIIVFCNRGNDSLVASKFLDNKGFQASALKGGLKKWNRIFDQVKLYKESFPQITIFQFKRLGKGCLSYVIADHKNSQSHLIDPSRNIEVYTDFVKRQKLPKISSVIDTHVHADHVSGGITLPKKLKIPYLLPERSRVKFRFQPIKKTLKKFFKNINVKVLNTPGHTPESVTIIFDKHYAFSGDTLLLDRVGRVDLDGGSMVRKQKMLYKSVTEKIFKLDDDIYIFPAHSSQPMTAGPLRAATLRYIKRFNMLNSTSSESEFLSKVNNIKIPPPINFRVIKEININGKFNPKTDLDELELGANACAIVN